MQLQPFALLKYRANSGGFFSEKFKGCLQGLNVTRLTEVDQMLYNPDVFFPPFIKKQKVYEHNPHSRGM